MGKIKAPKSFSAHFNISPEVMAKLGVLDPTLNVDTTLFIDPLLLVDSKHREFSQQAQSHYESYFQTVIELLSRSRSVGDVAWRNAVRLLSFPEVKWTCLGYGADSVAGSGSGAFTRSHVMQTATDIVQMGIENPDLFAALALLEDGIGPDRISDMTTNIILPEIVAFNERILKELKVPTERFTKVLANGTQISANLARNPHLEDDPVLLLPTDILRDLPIAADWSDVASAAQKNRALRARVNSQIAEIWKSKSKKDKDAIRRWALRDKSSFEIFLDMLRGANPKPYDFAGDPLGELIWRKVGEKIAQDMPFALLTPKSKNAAGLLDVVRQILNQFTFLIEKRGLWKELYHNGSPRPEKAAQRLFFAVAYAYCTANNIDITPEADTGSGVVDFKFSTGMNARVLVEIKLSPNPNVVKGHEKQITTYMESEETSAAFYVIVDVGRMAKKDQQLVALRNSKKNQPKPLPELIFIDGHIQTPASKR